MECKDILNLIAIVVIPIVAVVIGQLSLYTFLCSAQKKCKLSSIRVVCWNQSWELWQSTVLKRDSRLCCGVCHRHQDFQSHPVGGILR